MTRPRNKPPRTLNPEASALISVALAKCAGCRTVWRLNKAVLFVHGTDFDCTAQDERRQLREIAAKGKQNARARD